MWISWLLLLSSLLNGGPAPSSAAPAAVVHPQPVVPRWELDGVALGDDEWKVAAAWGRPGAIGEDEWHRECAIWSYDDGRNVGLCEGAVSFVQVTANAGRANLNGRELLLEDADLRQALGQPEFEAEDGWGVLNGDEAIKVFVDDRGELVSLDLFGAEC
ncbi:hypothetical protein B1A99_20565 [Cohnella sp. CIP 111063]|uniref:hypothetical protein n=1 Tax=unclassified Cohnella TaxID=2636738 RepID=UPI000B8C3F37|nr:MULTISPECIES: hypothetical protein [unclassified Cohnella]OXS56166.1 hypothetical protein B1A99_20565 [Cohnella sp. CIP 111063]PRX67801.1 hypothetical protein B0G52_11420 [Cohnella sp. SGD-V74]